MNYFNTALTFFLNKKILLGNSGTLLSIDKIKKNNRPKLKRVPKYKKDNFSTINRLEQYGYRKIKLFFSILRLQMDVSVKNLRGAIGIFLTALQQHRHGTAAILFIDFAYEKFQIQRTINKLAKFQRDIFDHFFLYSCLKRKFIFHVSTVVSLLNLCYLTHQRKSILRSQLRFFSL